MPCQNACCVPWCAFGSQNEDTKKRQGICSCHSREKAVACEKCNGMVFYAVKKESAITLQCRGCQTTKVFLIHVMGNQPLGW